MTAFAYRNNSIEIVHPEKPRLRVYLCTNRSYYGINGEVVCLLDFACYAITYAQNPMYLCLHLHIRFRMLMKIFMLKI